MNPRHRASTLRTTIALVALLGALGVVVAAAAWHVQGGRWYAVTSPSMGTAMPVGSLLLTRPASVPDVEVGDIVTFRTPTTHTVYSHRVVSRTATDLTTRGDINGEADPVPTVQADLIGRVVWHAGGLGWLLRGLPLVVVGLALTWLLSLLVRRQRRYSARMIGAALTLAVVCWVLHPWLGLVKLFQTAAPDGSGMDVQVVSTGLLPTRVFEVDGTASALLGNGEVGVLRLDDVTRGTFDLSGRLDLAWWGWVLLALVVLTPLLWTSLRGLPPLEEDLVGDPGAAPDPERTVRAGEHDEETVERTFAEIIARELHRDQESSTR